MTEILRGLTSVCFFAIFGVGALMISPFVWLAGSKDRGQRLVRASWRLLVWFFEFSRLIRIDSSELHEVKGTVLVANHPSFIDVVLLTALVPHTFCVAKHVLWRNPCMAMIVRKIALPDDYRLMEIADRHLKEGFNVLVFPEGTRSPERGLRRFHRGAAQLALRTGAPLVAIGIVQSRRILGKGQPPWDMGDSTVEYVLKMDAPTRDALRSGENAAKAARRVTESLTERIRGLTA